MEIGNKVTQLTELMADDLVPAVDQLVKNESATSQSITKLNTGIDELRLSNIKLADLIERLIHRIDRLYDFENRLKLLESKVL